MPATFHIRPATPADAGVIAEYNRRLAWETERKRLPRERLRRGVDAVLGDSRKGVYFVAESEADGSVIGQCSVTYEWSDWRNGDFWWLQSVYVNAAWRRRGVFRSLFDTVRQSATAAGAAGLRLYVEEDNRTAQETYARHGMHPTHYRIYELEFRRRRLLP